LVIEPDYIVAENLTELLLNAGYIVEVAHSDSAAIQIAANLKPQLQVKQKKGTGMLMDGERTGFSFMLERASTET
jgi:hypothetical protein